MAGNLTVSGVLVWRRDVMTHSFGEGYSTRSDEEGFGGVYGQNDPVFNPGTEVHPNHPGNLFVCR